MPRRIPSLAVAAGLLVLAGCGAPPELTDPKPSPSTAPSVATPPTTPPVASTPIAPPTAPTSTPSPTRFAESPAVACAGRPGPAAVIAVLRRAGLLSRSTRATVATGPLCAGTWQWSVVQVTGREPLQVVTRGTPGALTLVTAGTDVCNIPVRTGAPPGIVAAACDAMPPAQ